MRIGVVIPVFNRPRLLVEALESVLAQTRLPDVVRVVDDGSVDHTCDAARRFLHDRGAHSDWIVLQEPHRGAAPARQTGFLSCGEVDAVAFLDSDDLWPEDFVARAERALGATSGLVGVSADRVTHDVTKGTIKRESLGAMADRPLRWMLSHDAGLGSCTMIRASGLRRIGGYPTEERTGHDIVLFARLFAIGGWGHLPGRAATIRRHHAASVGEADHIYKGVSDANLRHARLYDLALTDGPVGERLGLEVRSAMARRWISAAKCCRTLHDPNEGLRCLIQAHRYRSVSIRGTRLKWQLRHDLRAQNGRRPTSAS